MRTRDKSVGPVGVVRSRALAAFALAGSAAVASALLAGCSDGSVPGPNQPPVTATVTDTVTPSPTASPTPTLPASAMKPTREGAQEFSKYYFAVYSSAFWAGDVERLRMISYPRCVFCNSAIKSIENNKAAGGRVVGGKVSVSAAAATPGDPAKALIVNLILQQEAGQTLDGAGRVAATTPALKDSRADVAVRWVSDRWILMDAHVFKQGET